MEKMKESIPLAQRIKKTLRTRIASLLARPNPEAIFILGHQKTGTTAIAALLAEMTGLSATLDLRRPRKHPVYHLVKSGQMSFAAFVRMNRVDFSRQLVKEPALSLFYDQLEAFFPKGRFVMVMRDPRDNLRSILNRLELPGNLEQLDEQQSTHVKRAWSRMLDGSWLGISGDNYIEMMAGRWVLIAETYLRNREKMLLIRYEDFMKDKIGAIAGLAQLLGLPQLRDIADKVDIQYQPRGNREVTWERFFGQENLGRIERICGGPMTALGYPCPVHTN
jgi:hypothetical protein